jgi:hypothetical protein
MVVMYLTVSGQALGNGSGSKTLSDCLIGRLLCVKIAPRIGRYLPAILLSSDYINDQYEFEAKEYLVPASGAETYQ